MNKIKARFLSLTKRTYPFGTEHELDFMSEYELIEDNFGNYYKYIGESNTMFASHLDTACKHVSSVKHVEEDGYIKTNGETILGADCKAGVTIMLEMIDNNIPGLYYFFIGEEVGCKGSKWVSSEMKNGYLNEFNIKKCISFDRRGTKSIITHQGDLKTASDEFANSLIEEFGKNGLEMEIDRGGFCTDSLQFVDIIPECTNISVGYYDEHRTHEKQDISFLIKMTQACIKINWETLNISRDESIEEYLEYDYSDYYEQIYGNMSSYNNSSDESNTWDNKYYTYILNNNERVKMNVSVERIEYEKSLIRDILIDWCVLSKDSKIDDVNWDGQFLHIKYVDDLTDVLTRADIGKIEPLFNTLSPEDVKVFNEEDGEVLMQF